MNIQEVGIEAILPYEKNPRINEPAVDYVAESIKNFGFKVPIIIDENFVIVCGHTRWKAAKKLGYKTVPCIVASDLSQDQIKAFRLADNKVAEYSAWDEDLLAQELADIADVFNMEDFGFLNLDDDLPTGDDNDFDVEKEKEKIKNPVSKLGDVWILGKHRLICGNSCDEITFQKLCGDEKIDLYLTDPPYNVTYQGRTKNKLTIQNDSMDSSAFLAFLTDAFATADSVMKAGCPFYVWHASAEVLNFYKALENIPKWSTKQYLLWVKNHFTFGRQDYQWQHEPCIYGWKEGEPEIVEEDYQCNHEPCVYGWKKGAAHYFIDDRKQSTVLEYDKPNRNGDHPTMKPVELFERLIVNSSREGENVLDSFGGSGTTLIACEKLKRKAFLCELDPIYCDVIVKRWENLTGKKAVLSKEK